MSKVIIAGDVNGSGVFTLAAPNGNTNRTLTLPDEAGTLVTTASLPNPLTSGTAVATTSGTSIDFTGIPSWAKRVTVMFRGVSTNGGTNCQVQLGTSGGVVTSGYLGAQAYISGSTPGSSNLTTGLTAGQNVGATHTRHGLVTIINVTSNDWASTALMALSNQTEVGLGAGSVSLSGSLTTVRITTINGTDTFDAGSINIMYE